MKKLFILILKHIKQNTEFSTQCTVINMQRLFLASILTMTINVVSIVIFSILETTHTHWKYVFILSHAILFVVMAFCLVVTIPLRRKSTPSLLVFIVQYLASFAIFFTGTMIVAIDQHVTNTVAAYFIACMIVGVATILRPLASSILFLISYVAFFIVLRIVSPNQEALVSHSINGLCAAFIGLFLSAIIWYGFCTKTIQQKRIQEQQLALEKANKELEVIAYQDSLTGLPNRRFFDNAVSKEAVRARRKGYKSSLIMLDIDFFKKINDVYGHPVGDSLLIQFSSLLQNNMRKYDIISRLAGDEFLVLLPDTTLKQAKIVAENLRGLIDNHVFIADDEEIHVTASFGVAELTLCEGISLIKQYAIADEALYQAKRNKKNCVL